MPTGPPKPKRVASSRARAKNGPRLTCVHCRSKKIRCDGALPGCGICAAYGKDCTYEKPPPMTQVIAMTERIKELERTLKELDSSPEQESSADRTPNTTSARRHDDYIPSSSANEEHQMSLEPGTYYASTSAVDAPGNASKTSTPLATNDAFMSTRQHDNLESSVDLNWEETAIANCAMHLHLPPDKIRHLLATHWTWVHPMFMFVNRPVFLRDAAVGGEYFSPLLLTVICLHSTRFTDHDLNERLFSYAKMLIGQEIHDPPSVPRVQAFLQLSAREIGRGSISQAWLYSGMAFRMALDLGLFTTVGHANGSVENASKRRITHKLAWSCYLWDKAMSLYLGRSPSLPQAPAWLDSMPEPSDTGDDWIPYGVSTVSPAYVTAPSYTEACFWSFCKLCVIICDILINLYGQCSTQNLSRFVKDTRRRLEEWYHDLPQTLKMGTNPVLCPNPQILIQNLLYHVTTILLLRPFRRVSACRAGCREAADAIEKLFLCMERTFGFTRVTYLMAYCAYIAATIAAQDANDNVPGAQHRVDTFIRVLSAIRFSCPGIERSLDIIKQSMSMPTSEGNVPPVEAQPTILDPMPNVFDSMPTFPLNCSTFGANSVTGMTSMPFNELDPYTYQWSTLHEDMLDGMSFEM